MDFFKATRGSLEVAMWHASLYIEMLFHCLTFSVISGFIDIAGFADFMVRFVDFTDIRDLVEGGGHRLNVFLFILRLVSAIHFIKNVKTSFPDNDGFFHLPGSNLLSGHQQKFLYLTFL